MPGHAKSQTWKAQDFREEKERLMKIAEIRYNEELKKSETKDWKGLRKICKELEEQHRVDTGKTITLNHMTLRNHIQGGKSLTKFNRDKGWLKPDEEYTVIDYVIDAGNRGFPFSYRRIKEHVDAILRARRAEGLPAHGVGTNWAERFVERHHALLRAGFARSLDTARGQAVNDATDKAWFDVLGDTVEERNIEPDCLWAVNETGFQASTAAKSEKAIAGRNKKVIYQQRTGERETTTVFVTICADGTSIPPAVIFKGEHYLAKWKQNNPAQASLGYSKKGWTDGEIGALWIKDFDQKTKDKAAGRTRLLLVDGHNSHYTCEFLDYAVAHDIVVLCYPSHTTHVYQGLDVVIFGALKKRWTIKRNAYEARTGIKISKENFLEVYGAAHIHVLNPKNIKAAFKATGVAPFNRNILPPEAKATSFETSNQHHMPLPFSTPIRTIVNAFDLLQQKREREARKAREAQRVDGRKPPDSNDQEDDDHESEDFNIPSDLVPVFTRLVDSTTHPLFSDAAITSEVEPPQYEPLMFSPVKRRGDLLEFEPQTEREQLLQEALREAEVRDAYQKGVLHGQQAAIVLQGLYCAKVQRKLASKEEKAANKGKKGKGRLVGDGLPRLLTAPEFVQAVADHKAAGEREERERVVQKSAKASYQEAMVSWNRSEVARKNRITERRAAWQREVKVWEEEVKSAKTGGSGRKAGKKPLLGPLEKAAPQPKLKDFVAQEKAGENSGNSGDTGGSSHGWRRSQKAPNPTHAIDSGDEESSIGGEEFSFAALDEEDTTDEGGEDEQSD